jgi:hypothetical protein
MLISGDYPPSLVSEPGDPEPIGRPATNWVALWSHEKPEKLARIAYRKHVRLSRLEGAALGVGGMITAGPDLVALAWIQSRMVFYIAAAHGYDANDPMRPAELLTLQGIYPSAVEARASLDGVGRSMAAHFIDPKLSSKQERALTERLMRYLLKRTVKRGLGRMIPLVGAPLGALQNGGATKDLGKRALAYYGGAPG